MSLSAYDDLVHELARLDADTAAGEEQANRQLERRREALRAVESELDDQVSTLAETCAALRATTPDLAPEPAEGDDIDAALTGARVNLREAADARLATVRAAQRPTLLPGVHHILRELLVYGSCMIACLIGQLIYLRATGGSEATWGVTFLAPVLALFVAYVLVGVANKPRLPMLDRNGKPIKAVVPHNPRLGVTLAVVTMALFAYFAFFA